MTKIDQELLKELYEYFSQDFEAGDAWDYTDTKKAEIAAKLREYVPVEGGYTPTDMRSY